MSPAKKVKPADDPNLPTTRTENPGTAEKATRGTLQYVDDHFGSSNFLKRSMDKVFPDHWSFMLGEIALYSFVILLLSGVYLTLFFHASQNNVVYQGSYQPLRGVQMTEAYASTLHISFDVRGGLLMRQIHHWAALLFVTSIVVHMFRVFFTGAFRKPRTINWHIGTILMILGILEGFAGYSLPDDLLSGTGLRIAYSVAESIPVVGTYLCYFLFGGNYPGQDIISRLFIIHVLLVPGILLALIAAHMMILWHQKHTDFPGPGKTEENVIGTKFYPGFFLKTNGFLFMVFGMIAGLAAFAQINPVWLYGPYNAGQVSAGSQPDWYILFLEGSLRMMPNWETHIWHHTISWNIFIPGVIIPGIMFNLLALYPNIEAWVLKDRGYHNLLDRPRDVPVRTALGVMSLTFYMVLVAAGANDILASTFHWSLQATTWVLRVLLIVLPPIAFKVTKRICLGLQHHDEALLHHGVETGIIRRLPSGAYVEIEEPLPAQKAETLAKQIGYDPAHHGNGHAAISAGNGHKAEANGSSEITRPVGVMAKVQSKLEAFWDEPRETVPDTQPHPDH
ncbi:MAG TPA: cytochrome bc complex cytochrome b subunit [Mycobacteriales bacterium]|jgi:ubiquinol-cytochrome c reductase cytochrome b subunit|nr:cytochrome bc complex cytochrome b subunit [Mycobacteriales bacterium]